ncbi:O-antigen ligase family protein [Pseudomonas gingeri]|uniref:Flippase-like domain-containing protein n=1 Tax=Pseudomonas gingeri TaxID=117681 RepID=A0A7Y7WPY0_9PSED|nr:O-antigen ligase family protein [Pseudomonas gingeri]NWB85481.1 flippase-like domain-containing protein [Pseudomonas gingeri]
MSFFKGSRRYVGVLTSVFLIVALFAYFGPASVYEQLKAFPLSLSVGVFLLITLNVLVVIYRYWRILSHVGFRLPWGLVFRASSAANIASLLIIPLFGQMAGRQAVLQAAGVSAVENAVIAAYERVLVGCISAVLAFIGGGYLLGTAVKEYVALVPFDEIVPLVLLAVFVSLFFSISRFERLFYQSLFTKRNVLRFFELVFITLVSSVLMLSSFALLFNFVVPSTDWFSVFSVAAVVSFAAGLPISFGGWGLREIAAVYFLGYLHVESDKAMAASILCGVLSVGAIIFMAPFALKTNKAVSSMHLSAVSIKPYQSVIRGVSIESVAAWILCFSVALFVMFQVHFPVAGSTININIADPFAVLALSVVFLDSIFQRQLPLWRVPRFNYLLLLMSVILLFGFFHGWLNFGSSSWAFSKIFGWLVLLGFLASGYLAVSYHGVRGARRIIEVMVVVLCLILLSQMVLHFLHIYKIIEWRGFTPAIEGYAENRNALAFQILSVSAAFIGLLPMYKDQRLRFFPRVKCEVLFVLSLGWMMTGLYYTSSRSGIFVMFLLLAFASLTRIAQWRVLLKALMVSIVLWLLILYLPETVKFLSASTLQATSNAQKVQPSFSDQSSDVVRWMLIKQAISVWIEAPVFGRGLGYFFMKSPELVGFPIIIHNTFLWLMAETGVVGATGFLFSFILVVKCLVVDKVNRVRNGAAILLIFCFVFMSLFHEILYQRIFWFILGALIAVSFSSNGQKNPHKQEG